TLAENGDLPVNLDLVVEGEEEVGSQNLGKFLTDNRDALKCDVVLVSDTGMIARKTPTISYGLRGVAALEIKVTGPKMDLHSGIFGGAVANPATALARMLATLHDADGHVAVPGFYDDVVPLQDWEREAWKKLPIDADAEMLGETKAPALFGEKGFSTLERIWARPTAEINGMGSGYQGPGTKTVLPSHALAQLKFPLAPSQQACVVAERVKKHLQKNLPPGVTLEMTAGHHGPWYLTDPNGKFG